jgi:alanyl-tRNA synthetase
LQKHLGKDAHQMGSKVDDDWLRFDFGSPAPVPMEKLAAIEQDVAERIAAAEPIRWEYVPLAQARALGAMMLFGEKYPDPARLVTMGDFSRELCGGTHLTNTAQIGGLEILAEEAVAAGVRRITAVTGVKAQQFRDQTRAALWAAAEKLHTDPLSLAAAARQWSQYLRELRKAVASGGSPPAPPQPPASRPFPMAGNGQQWPPFQIKAALREAARVLNVAPFDVPDRLEAMLTEAQQLQRELAELATHQEISVDALLATAERHGPVTVVVAEVPGANPNRLRQLIDQVRQRTSQSAVFLASREGENKVLLVAGLSRELVAQGLSAGNWVRDVAPVVGGGGGGKPDLAQAGGKQPQHLPEALAKARQIIAGWLQALPRP